MGTQKMRTIIARKFDPRRGKFVNHAVDSGVYNAAAVEQALKEKNDQGKGALENGTYTIGRKDRRRGPRLGPAARRDRRTAQLWVNHDTVSNVHAELDVLNGRLYLKDLNSTNGTFVVENGKRVRFQEGYVELDQQIYLGDWNCTPRQLLDMV